MPKKLPRQESSKSRTSSSSSTRVGKNSLPATPARKASHSVAGGPYTLHANSSAELRTFIHNFDFTNSDLTDYPYSPNFPNILSEPEALRAGGSHGLTKHEQGILTGIRLAWYTTRAGKKYLLRKTAQAGGIMAAVIIALTISLNTLNSPTVSIIREVGAATVSASLRSITTITGAKPDGIIQSTMSAIMR